MTAAARSSQGAAALATGTKDAAVARLETSANLVPHNADTDIANFASDTGNTAGKRIPSGSKARPSAPPTSGAKPLERAAAAAENQCLDDLEVRDRAAVTSIFSEMPASGVHPDLQFMNHALYFLAGPSRHPIADTRPHTRLLTLRDTAALLDLEHAKWTQDQAASPADLQARIAAHPGLSMGSFCPRSGMRRRRATASRQGNGGSSSWGLLHGRRPA